MKRWLSCIVGDVVYEDAPERLAKGIPHYPIPVLLLARLAVDYRWQGKGLGAALVVDAMRRTLQVADIAGVRALLVHAKDDAAGSFYMHLGFEPFPDEPLVLYRLVKDFRAMREKRWITGHLISQGAVDSLRCQRGRL